MKLSVIFNSALAVPSLQSDNVILFLSPSVNRCFVLHLTMPLNGVFCSTFKYKHYISQTRVN